MSTSAACTACSFFQVCEIFKLLRSIQHLTGSLSIWFKKWYSSNTFYILLFLSIIYFSDFCPRCIFLLTSVAYTLHIKWKQMVVIMGKDLTRFNQNINRQPCNKFIDEFARWLSITFFTRSAFKSIYIRRNFSWQSVHANIEQKILTLRKSRFSVAASRLHNMLSANVLVHDTVEY